MVKTSVVSAEVDLGAEILEILERANVKVSVALWMFLSEYEDWRLVMSSQEFDFADPRDSYHLLHDSLAAAGFGVKKIPPVLIMPSNDPFICTLRDIFGKTENVEGMRIGGQMIGDRFVEDAYVYRIS